MPELRKDPVTGTWVIIAPERQKRPIHYQIIVEKDTTTPQECPFCPGNEALTPAEVYAVRPPGSVANGSGWELRVIPNKFPALRIEGELARSGEGMFDRMNGIGAHEVFIETTDHRLDLADLPVVQMQRLLAAFQARILDLRNDMRFRYVMVFKNRGFTAGATLAHSHSQLIALPVIPIRVQEELEGARVHFQLKERCVFCDIIRSEREAGRRLLFENDHFIAVAPFAPRFSFELCIYPKRHEPAFENSSAAEMESLATLLKETLSRVNRALNRPDYNMILHNSPLANNVKEYYHWHLEFSPVLTRVAGFEWGTGFYINPVAPEESVQALKSF